MSAQENTDFRLKVYKAGLPHVPGLLYRNPDGSPGGFSAEILDSLARDENITLEWIDGSWMDLYEMLVKGEIDLLPGVQITPERATYLDFMDKTLFNMWSELYIRKSDKKAFSIASLSGKKIGMVWNDNNGIGFEKYIAQFNLKYQRVMYNTHDQLWQALYSGDVFAATGPKMHHDNSLNRMGLVSSGMYFNPTEVRVALPKGKNTELRQALDSRLDKYKSDSNSIYHMLFDKYGLGASPGPEKVISVYLVYFVFFLLFFAVSAAIFILVLKRQVASRTIELLNKEKELILAHNELKSYSANLERKVNERTEQLKEKNLELEQSMAELQRTQGQMILSEKMAVLGNLVAGIAHEINSPLGAIGSSCDIISENIVKVMKDIDKYHLWFNGPYSESIRKIFYHVIANVSFIQQQSTREERIARNFLAGTLEKNQIPDFDRKADVLVDFNLHNNWQEYLDFLKSDISLDILDDIARLNEVLRSCSLIENAVEKASRIVKALKNYMFNTSAKDGDFVQVPVDLRDGLDTVLLLFHNRIKHGIKLEKNYSAVQKVLGNSDELNQVWTNLIQNSLQAMDNTGSLALEISSQGEYVAVRITDSGCGIPESIIGRVFEPLFTTKKPGEGTGLGMDIVKRIVEKHNGNITLESTVGKGTTVSVFLPVAKNRE